MTRIDRDIKCDVIAEKGDSGIEILILTILILTDLWKAM